MSARESLAKMILKKQEDGKILFLVHSHERDDFPITDKMIRIQILKGTYMWQEGDDVKSINFNQMNMGGYFPMRLMNMSMSSIIKKAITQQITDLKKMEKGEQV